jgi:uncharacterized protein YndB with AHSA1/START domain
MSKLKILPGAPNEIVMSREFDAPRRLVIQAMTTPRLVKRWLGGVRAEVLSAEIDFRVGGHYRYVFRVNDAQGGGEFSFSGTYLEVGEDRIVHTERFNDDPNEATVTMTFSEQQGRTKFHTVMAFASKDLRDFVEGTGMAEGAGESYDALDGVLTSL